MPAPYDSPPEGATTSLTTMMNMAADLRSAHDAAGRRPCRLAPLVLMSDRDRTPDLEQLARRMPTGSALIYREAVGGHDLALAERLGVITRGRGVQYLIAGDPRVAVDYADGVHLPRGDPGAASLRRRAPRSLITRAAHKDGTPEGGTDLLDALFVSSVFPSRSPSAGTPIGVAALTRRAALTPCPVFALGGVGPETAPALLGSGAAGFASIDGLAAALRNEAPKNETPRNEAPRNQTPRTDAMTKAPDTTTEPIEARPDGHVSISKQEGGERIVFTADVTGASATGELTLRRVADGVWNANHTGVPSEIGGRGVGKALVKALVEDARRQGYRVVPGCPFVAKLFERHPDWAEGVAA
ncbi:N-acetyltransferase [uncultured Algimonas sp.]|uniref:N-acetyltransferase n=1 Tax=uncultured Algimonas sp. TaxID=1547920 RepID=UPI002634A647|nr:N-acetyltransferase [uncultured Algimonas sp.]